MLFHFYLDTIKVSYIYNSKTLDTMVETKIRVQYNMTNINLCLLVIFSCKAFYWLLLEIGSLRAALISQFLCEKHHSMLIFKKNNEVYSTASNNGK